ncbi:FAD/FMN-dependent dehydrogenase [Thermus thermophilus]|nr:FAD/FMN-dependent dehydrogenase [Thermus thermophilus]
MEARLKRLQDLLGEGEVLAEDEAHWEAVRDLGFLEGSPIWVKVPAKPHLIPELEGLPLGPRRYLDGGEVLYAGATEEGLKALKEAGLPHLVLRGRKRPSSPSPKEPSSPGSRRPWTPRAAFP